MTTLNVTTGFNTITPAIKARILRALRGYGYALKFDTDAHTYLSVFEDGEGDEETPDAIHVFDTIDFILDKA